MKVIIKKKGTKILAFLLALIMVLGVIPVSYESKAAEPMLKDTEIFTDTFDNGSTWNSTYWNYTGGKQYKYIGDRDGTAPLGYNSSATDSNRNMYKQSLTDVHIKADVCVTEVSSFSSKKQYHLLFARGTNTGANSIAFGFETEKNTPTSSLVVAIYNADDNPTILHRTDASYAIDATGTNAYTLDLYVIGTQVIAKCNGTTIYSASVDNINQSAGYCGILDKRATRKATGVSTLSDSSVYGTDYFKGGYFDNFYLATVEEVVVDGFRINGPVVAKADGTGVADITLISGGTDGETKEDVAVTVAGLENKPVGLYEGEYTVTATLGGQPKTAIATRVFVVDDLSKTVTNMSDSRWTGATATDGPNFTVDETGKATLTNQKYSVLSMGENDGAYNEFYAEYTLNLSDIATGKRNWYSTCFNIGTRASYSSGFTGDVLHDLRENKEVFYSRLQNRAAGNTVGEYAKGTTDGDVALGDSMRIGMLVYDNVITYSLNGNTVASYTYPEGTEASKGWLALYNDIDANSGVKATVENFVYIPLEKKVISVEFDAPQAVMQGGTVEVKATPTYTWPYGVGEQTTVGVVLDGLDTSTDGEKTYTASFGGIQKQLTINVTKKPDGFRVNGPIVMTKNGKGVADVTILAGTSELEKKEDVEVSVAGLSDPDTGLYEGSYEVSTLVSGVMCKATANRVFVVDNLSKTVTNMSDSRWTGATATDEPNFTVDEAGKAALTNRKYSVLSMGENDGAYNEFYAEYTLNLSDIPVGKRNWYSTCFNISTRANYSTGFTGDILHDLRDGKEAFYARLQQRQGNKELGSYAKGTSDGDVNVGDSMRIGLLVYDNVITYTLNGNVVGTYTYSEGTEASKGWLALYNEVESSSKATVENFIFVPIGEKVIQDIAFSYPEKVLPGASVAVSAVPMYNWPYGEGEAVTEGVVVTGLDTSTLGEKTFKASYGGVEKTLQLVVSNVLFEEDFDGTLDDLIDNGWGNVSKTTASLKEDKLYLLGNQEGLYATEVVGSDAWTDYTVKADAMITTNGNSAKTNIASLVARSTGLYDGYEWSLCVNKDGTSYVRLYDREAKKELIKVDYPVDVNEVYAMKLTVVGDTIKGYINGEKIIETTSSTCPTGTVGVRRNGYGVYYDNVIVTLPEEDAPVQDVSKQQVWFTDTFEAETTMAERGWDIDGTIQNGELVLTHKNATAFLTQIPGSANWADYTAQANVTVVDSDEISSVNNSVSALIVRSTSGKTGYEFGVLIKASDDKGGFRLYNRTTGEALASTTDVIAERGKNYQLTAVVEGNRIRCFVDGQLVFDVTDNANSNPTGYVGLRTVGYSGAYDNIIVRKITDADRKGVISGTATSPTTGDYAMSMYIPIVLMVSALATTVFVIRRRYNTNK